MHIKVPRLLFVKHERKLVKCNNISLQMEDENKQNILEIFEIDKSYLDWILSGQRNLGLHSQPHVGGILLLKC